MRLEFVEMVHPKLPGQPYSAPKQAVAHLQRSGWQIAGDVADQAPADPPPDPPAPEDSTEAPADAGASAFPDPPRDDQPPPRRRATSKEGE